MLLIKQGILSALKHKMQMIVFVILIIISSMLATVFYITNTRLYEANKMMGYGSFNYNYSFRYLSSGQNSNNAQTLSPWYAISADYTSYYTGQNETGEKITAPTLGIGGNCTNGECGTLKDLDLHPQANKIVTIEKDKSEFRIVPLNPRDRESLAQVLLDTNNTSKEQQVENLDFGPLYRLNKDSKYFQNSVIGQIYSRYIANKDSITPEEYQKAVDVIYNYMTVLKDTLFTWNITDLIIGYFNYKLDKVTNSFNSEEEALAKAQELLDTLNSFFNPSPGSTPYDYKNVSSQSSTNVITVDDYQGGNFDEIYKNGLKGRLGFVVKDKKDSNKLYYFWTAKRVNPVRNPTEYEMIKSGAYTVRRLEAQLIRGNYTIPMIDRTYVSAYYQLVGFLTNYNILFRDQAAAWNGNSKFRFIPYWSVETKIVHGQPTANIVFDNDMLKIIEKSPHWSQVEGHKDSVIISPQYAKAKDLIFGSELPLDVRSNLIVQGYGADTLNIFPTIYDNDLLPDLSSQAIIYVSHDKYRDLFDNDSGYNPDAYQDVSMAFMQHTKGQNTAEQDYELFKLYSADNVKDLEDITNVISNPNRSNTDIQRLRTNTVYSTFKDNKNINRRYSLLNSVVKQYGVFAIICILLFLIIICFISGILLKKIVDKQKAQIGILKASGYTTWQISFSYMLYVLVGVLIAVPIGWALALPLQIPILNIFANYFIIPVHFSANALPLLYLLILFIVIVAGGVLLMCYMLLREDVLSLLNPNRDIKPNMMIVRLMSRVKFKTFTGRFRMILMSVSIKNIVLFFITFFLATAILTIGLLLPLSIKDISNKYYANLKYNNEFNYRPILYNNPLSRYSFYKWDGKLDDVNGDKITPQPIQNINPIADFVQEGDEDNYKAVFGNVKTTATNVDKTGDVVTRISPADYPNFVQNMLVYNVAQVKNANFSIALLYFLYDNAPPDQQENVGRNLQMISCDLLPSMLGQSPIDNPPGINVKDKIASCVEQSTNTILPSNIKEQWQKSLKNKYRFSFGFDSIPYNPKTDKLYTNFISNIVNINGNSEKIDINTYGITPDTQSLINIKNSDIFKPIKKYSGGPAIDVPVIINRAVANRFGVGVGDELDFGTRINGIQFKGKDGEFKDIDNSWWKYPVEKPTNVDPSTWTLEDLSKVDDLAKFTYSTLDKSKPNSSWGYDNKKGEIVPYHRMQDIVLQIPADEINEDFWKDQKFKITDQGKTEKTVSMLGTTAKDSSTDAFANKTITIKVEDGKKYYLIKPYDVNFDHALSDSLVNLASAGFSSSWYNAALSTNLIRSTNSRDISSLQRMSNYRYKVIGIQDSYDDPRIFLGQNNANQILNYPVDLDSTVYDADSNKILDEQEYWKAQQKYSNGKFSTETDPLDQTTRFTFTSINGNYTVIDFKNNFTSALGRVDYLNAKIQILSKLTFIAISIALFFIITTIVTAMIVIFLITDVFLTKYTKFIATLQIQGYNMREINSMMLWIFLPFTLIAWAVGIGITWAAVSVSITQVLLRMGITIPFSLPYVIIPFILAIILVIFAVTYITSIRNMMKLKVNLLSSVDEE